MLSLQSMAANSRSEHTHRDFAAMLRALTPGQGHPGKLKEGSGRNPLASAAGTCPFPPFGLGAPRSVPRLDSMFSWWVNVGKRAHGGDEEGAGQDDTPPQSTAGIPALRCEGKPHVLGHPGRLADSDSELLPSETRNGMTPCRKPHAVCTRRRDFLTASAHYSQSWPPRRLTNRKTQRKEGPPSETSWCVYTRDELSGIKRVGRDNPA